jgi:hypothetical protein
LALAKRIANRNASDAITPGSFADFSMGGSQRCRGAKGLSLPNGRREVDNLGSERALQVLIVERVHATDRSRVYRMDRAPNSRPFICSPSLLLGFARMRRQRNTCSLQQNCCNHVMKMMSPNGQSVG